MLTVDLFLDMNTADGNGTTLTPTILANGMQGVSIGGAGWSISPTPVTGLTIDAHQQALPDTVNVRGVGAFSPSHASRTIQVDNTKSFIVGTLSFSGISKTAISIGGWIKFGPANINPSSALYDLWQFQGATTGRNVTFQLKSGGSGVGTGYGVNLETNPGGVTQHSAYIQVTPGSTYWATVLADYGGGTAKLNVYDTAGALIGAVTTTQQTGENVGVFTLGQNEAGTGGGTSWYENLILDFTTATFPLGPVSSTASLGAPPGSGTYPQVCVGFAR